ncbi:MAG: carbon monoxide dehydrogenase [Desulfovibrionaceae bacterium]|nr:carbon monoxide dehydrogenase [Desulfovibrionaceae bacterium]MBF0514339.1 carbon monoxide dehydrogenase [Desulfovibrionaceae bacterium]
MRLAIAGKGGVGKTSLAAWLGDYLRRLGREVWLVDADTAYSLGPALGLEPGQLPRPLCEERELIVSRTGSGVINLNPRIDDLPDKLALDVRGLKLLVMGTVAGAGGGCACEANAVLKALLAHLFLGPFQWVLVDLEAGVEHLGRGTAARADGLIVVSDPSLRGLQTAARIGLMARDLGLTRQALVVNRVQEPLDLPDLDGLPGLAAAIPALASLSSRQLRQSSVLDLPEQDLLDRHMAAILDALEAGTGKKEISRS